MNMPYLFEGGEQDWVKEQSQASQQEFVDQIVRLIGDDSLEFIPDPDDLSEYPEGKFISQYLLPHGSLLEITQPNDYDLGGYHDDEVYEPYVRFEFTIYENGTDTYHQPWVIKHRFEYGFTWEKPEADLVSDVKSIDNTLSVSNWEEAVPKFAVRYTITTLTPEEINMLAVASSEEERADILDEDHGVEDMEANIQYFLKFTKKQEAHQLATKQGISTLTDSELRAVNRFLSEVNETMSVKSLGLVSLIDK